LHDSCRGVDTRRGAPQGLILRRPCGRNN
jgi:hypothetical protein